MTVASAADRLLIIPKISQPVLLLASAHRWKQRWAHSMETAETLPALYFPVPLRYFYHPNCNFWFFTKIDVRDYIYLMVWNSKIFFFIDVIWNIYNVVVSIMSCSQFLLFKGCKFLMLKFSCLIFSFYKIWVRFKNPE